MRSNDTKELNVGVPADEMKIKLTQADLKFISENMKLSGFSGKITSAIANYEVDMEKIAESARRFGAQIPKSDRDSSRKRPKISRWQIP